MKEKEKYNVRDPLEHLGTEKAATAAVVKTRLNTNA